MSALGQKRTYAMQKAMSALPPIATAKADIRKTPCLLYPRKQTCAVHQPMSALGQKRTCAAQHIMSALPPIATSIAFVGMSTLGHKRTLISSSTALQRTHQLLLLPLDPGANARPIMRRTASWANNGNWDVRQCFQNDRVAI